MLSKLISSKEPTKIKPVWPRRRIILFQILLFLVSCIGTGCSTNPVYQPALPTQAPTAAGTPAPAFTHTPTNTASPTPISTRTPTPTYVPWHTLPPPTPFFFETDWTLAYTALVIDSTTVPVEYHGEINTIQLNEKIPVKLAQNIGSGSMPRWCPDGKRLAFIKAQVPSSLIILDLATGQMGEINDVWEYAWSRDGQRILYCDDFFFRTPPFHCYLSQVDRLTESRKMLISEDWYVDELKWSPSQDQILALAVRDVGPTEIYLLFPDGKIEHIQNKYTVLGNLAWYPDGEKIAYATDGDARVIDLNTQKDFRLTSTGKRVVEIAWSPDGKNLAYTEASSQIDMYLLNLGTGKTSLISHNGLQTSDPSWSPDGKYLAYLEHLPFNKFDQGCSIQVYELKTGISSRVLASGVLCEPVSWKPMQ